MPKTISDETLRVVRNNLKIIISRAGGCGETHACAVSSLAALDADGRTRGEIVAEREIRHAGQTATHILNLGIPYFVYDIDIMRRNLAKLIDAERADAVAEDRKTREE